MRSARDLVLSSFLDGTQVASYTPAVKPKKVPINDGGAFPSFFIPSRQTQPRPRYQSTRTSICSSSPQNCIVTLSFGRFGRLSMRAGIALAQYPLPPPWASCLMRPNLNFLSGSSECKNLEAPHRPCRVVPHLVRSFLYHRSLFAISELSLSLLGWQAPNSPAHSRLTVVAYVAHHHAFCVSPSLILQCLPPCRVMEATNVSSHSTVA